MNRTRLLLLCATVLVDMIGFGIVLPLLPFYAEELGASPFQVTLIIASFSAMQLAAAPLWGRVSDRHGRKPILVLGLIVSTGAYVLFGFAETLGVLLLSRMVAGAAGGTVGVAHAYIADSTATKERARGLGYVGAAAGLGVMIGPAIGGWFSQWGLGMPGFVAAGLCLIDAAATLFFLPESRPEERRGPSAASRRVASLRGWVRALTGYPLSLLLSVYFLSISSFAALTSVLALYLERAFGMDAADMGLVMMASGGVTIVARGVMLGPLVAWLGEARTARIGAASLSGALLAVPLIPSEWWLPLVIVLYAAGAGTLFPSLASMVSRATHGDVQGSILGGQQMIGGFGRVVGPVWAGLAFQHIGIGSPFLIGCVIVACALVLALRVPDAGFDYIEEVEPGEEVGAASSAGAPS